MNGATAFPLAWPTGWPRARARERNARFRTTPDRSRRKLLDELRMLGATNVVISSNAPVRQDGQPYADAGRYVIHDPGVAVYFRLRGQQLAMARDAYEHLGNNLHSLALAVQAIRAIERHGGSYMMQRAFSGFVALPPPGRSCWEVLGIKPGSGRDEINRAFRDRAQTAHPDQGGSHNVMAELSAARDAALRESAE